MKIEKIESDVLAIFAEKLKTPSESISKSAKIREDLGIDSVEIIEVVAQLEQVFGVKVPEEEIAEIETVQDVIMAVSSHGGVM